jgi:hypothetical protein
MESAWKAGARQVGSCATDYLECLILSASEPADRPSDRSPQLREAGMLSVHDLIEQPVIALLPHVLGPLRQRVEQIGLVLSEACPEMNRSGKVAGSSP